MPALKNLKHEAFIQHLLAGQRFGLSQGTAYIKAGFRTSGHAAEVNAGRLLKRADIKARLAELVAPAVKRTKATVDSLAQQFDEVFDGAMGDRQFGPAGSVAVAKAKLLGFMRDRLEVGRVGEFDAGERPDEVGRKWLESCGGSLDDALAQLDSLREIILRVAVHEAVDITPATLASPGDETRAALAALRPTPEQGRRN